MDDKMDVDTPDDRDNLEEFGGPRKKRKEMDIRDEESSAAETIVVPVNLPNKKPKETEKSVMVGWVSWHNATIEWPRIFVKTSARQKHVSMAVPIDCGKNPITFGDIKLAIAAHHGAWKILLIFLIGCWFRRLLPEITITRARLSQSMWWFCFICCCSGGCVSLGRSPHSLHSCPFRSHPCRKARASNRTR
jgi:hypothetical protein